MPVGKKLRTQAPEGPTPQTASLVPSLGFPEPFYDPVTKWVMSSLAVMF